MRRSILGLACFFMCAIGAVLADDKASAPSVDLYNKAIHLYEKHKWEAATEYLHQYLAEYSDSPLYITCLYYLGYCYQQMGNAREAASIYHKVMAEAMGGDKFWGQMAEKRAEELSVQPPGS